MANMHELFTVLKLTKNLIIVLNTCATLTNIIMSKFDGSLKWLDFLTSYPITN